jgi:thiosulfate/3-mercaptopyruvate sulfurtransferase
LTRQLISVPELHAELGELALFDVRWHLTEPGLGRRQYLEGHIPTAVFVDLDRDLAAPEGPGRHPLPTPRDFAATLSRLGVGSRSDVVVYDDAGGSTAARMWWMLSAIGHRGTVRVLDGGWQTWVESGYEVEAGEVVPGTDVYPIPTGFSGVIDAEGVSRMGNSHLLLDARAPERYRGAVEPIDPRAGHIPGAVSAPWQGNMAPDGRMKDPTALRRRFDALGAGRRPTVVSCGSGVNACQMALALEIAGLPRPLVYVGSFSDWSRSERPVVEGPNPG